MIKAISFGGMQRTEIIRVGSTSRKKDKENLNALLQTTTGDLRTAHLSSYDAVDGSAIRIVTKDWTRIETSPNSIETNGTKGVLQTDGKIRRNSWELGTDGKLPKSLTALVRQVHTHLTAIAEQLPKGIQKV